MQQLILVCWIRKDHGLAAVDCIIDMTALGAEEDFAVKVQSLRKFLSEYMCLAHIAYIFTRTANLD